MVKMKKIAILFLLIFAENNLFALSVDSTVVPWTTGLRIRENSAVSSKAIAYLGLWEKLTIMEIKNESETINGNTGNWVKVRRENRQTTGWCFSYFLEEIDENNFFPILEIKGYDNSQMYTFYNDGKKREKLVLYWNNKTIENYDKVNLSGNGKIMAFVWIDPTTIKRNSGDRTISGNRYFFVYNFGNHRLIKIDEKSNGSFGKFALNSNGTKLFYDKDRQGIEVDLLSINHVKHQINLANIYDINYIGNYIYIERNNENGNDLYDPSRKKTIMTFKYHSHNFDDNEFYRYPVIISNDRYLVIKQNDNSFKGTVIHDLVTSREQQISERELIKNIESSNNRNDYPEGKFRIISYQEDCYYITPMNAHSEKKIIINKVDYNNKILSQYKFDNITYKMSSFLSFADANNAGIVEFQYGDQAWMIIYLFNNTFLEYRIDNYGFSFDEDGFFSIYLMNAK